MNSKNHYLKVFRVVFYILLSLSSYLSLQPIHTPDSPLFWDKLWHTITHFTLFVFLDRGFSPNKHLAVKALALLIYGLIIEVIQRFLPYRTFSLRDLAANILGLVLYFLIRNWLARVQNIKVSHSKN